VRVLVLLCVLAQVAHAEVVVGYRNGKPIELQVTEVDGVVIEVTTARAFVVMRDAAAEAGVYLQPWSGFRSHERQKELHDDWKAGVGNPAAKPGYSNHQTGRAIDINLLGVPKETFAWLTKNAARFGFRRTVASEPWHWEYSPPRRTARARHARR
jgi:LAS superfamily LD-carboxypeptidase LdcB